MAGQSGRRSWPGKETMFVQGGSVERLGCVAWRGASEKVKGLEVHRRLDHQDVCVSWSVPPPPTTTMGVKMAVVTLAYHQGADGVEWKGALKGWPQCPILTTEEGAEQTRRQTSCWKPRPSKRTHVHHENETLGSLVFLGESSGFRSFEPDHSPGDCQVVQVRNGPFRQKASAYTGAAISYR